MKQDILQRENILTLLKSKFNTITRENGLKLQSKTFELHVMTNYLTNILNNINQGILFINLEGIVTTVNSAAGNILNLSLENILFQPFWKTFPDDIFGFSMQECLKSKKAPRKVLIEYKQANGTKSELEISGTLILEENSALIGDYDYSKGLILLVRDITEIREWQQIANRNDRMKELGEMAAMVAHEIRNPLGGIKGFASLLARDLHQQPHLQQMAQYIVDGTDNLNQLVTDVLNYAKPFQMKFEAVNLIDLLHEIRQHVLMDSALIKKIKFQFKPAAKEIILSIDKQHFKSMMLNLIVNAIEAMPQEGTLTIEAHMSNGQAIIEVQDTGIGIPKEHQHKIFSPFFTTKPEGHGFGLAEVYKIVQAHAGTIDLYSKPSHGTTFIIRLPT